MRGDPRQDDAAVQAAQARLHQAVRADDLARRRNARQRRRRPRSADPGRRLLRRVGPQAARRAHPRPGGAATGDEARPPGRRGDPGTRPGQQRRAGAPCVRRRGGQDRPLADPSRSRPTRHQDLVRRPDLAASPGAHHADVERQDRQGSPVQPVHAQRRATDPVAHADRPPALLPRPRELPRLGRELAGLQAAARSRHADGDRAIAGRGPGRPPVQLHHPARQVVDPLDLRRQRADDDALAWWLSGLAQRQGRRQPRHRRQRLGRALQRQRHLRAALHHVVENPDRHRVRVPRHRTNGRHSADPPRRQTGRHEQLAHENSTQAGADERRLRPVHLRLQLLGANGCQPRHLRLRPSHRTA